jgi:hypothetical protein
MILTTNKEKFIMAKKNEGFKLDMANAVQVNQWVDKNLWEKIRTQARQRNIKTIERLNQVLAKGLGLE